MPGLCAVGVSTFDFLDLGWPLWEILAGECKRSVREGGGGEGGCVFALGLRLISGFRV